MYSPTEIYLSHSRFRVILILGSHILALLSLVVVDVMLLLKLPLALLCLFSCVWHAYRWFKPSRQEIEAVRWYADQREFSVRLRSGRWMRAESVHAATVLPYGVIMRLGLEEPQRGSYTLLLWRDSMSVESFRRLRVLCRYARYPKVANATDS